jgi:hypothetical protein
MKTIVITISEDICALNQRDPEGTALIEAAKSFGTVTSWDEAIAAERAKWQSNINNLTMQLEAIKEKAVTATELEILRALRKKAASEGRAYEDEIATLKGQLEQVVAESASRAEKIKAILG